MLFSFYAVKVVIMIKKIILAIILSVFLFVDFACIVVPPRTDPPPRKRTYKTRKPGPGYVWIKGHWKWKRGNWHWKNGYWVKKKSGKTWIPGRWRKKNGKKVWIKGHWVRH